MPDLNCGTLTADLSCDSSEVVLSADNSSESEVGYVVLAIPDGSEILDPDGQLLFTTASGFPKCKIKIPTRSPQ